MQLTTAQLQALGAALAADTTPVGGVPVNALPRNPDAAFAMAALYNQPAAPAFTVWRSSVQATEVMSNGFVWTAVDGLTVGKARIWDWMTRYGSFDPSKANVRQGLADCFGAASAMVAAILPHCKRFASKAEKLFATGTGSDAAPGTAGAEGSLSYQNVIDAWNS